MQAAREIFREHGYAAATIRAIATRADVGTGTIFSYVRDKRDLLGKIFDEELQELTDACLDGLVPEAPLFDQLMQIFGPRYAYWAVDPTLSRLACQDSFGTSAAERTVYTGAGLFHARRSRIAQFLSDLIRAKQRSGEVFPTHDPVLVGYLLMDVYIGANRRWLTHDVLIPEEGVEELRQLFAIAIRGLRVPASAN